MAVGTDIIFEYALELSLLDEEARQALSAIMAAGGVPRRAANRFF